MVKAEKKPQQKNISEYSRSYSKPAAEKSLKAEDCDSPSKQQAIMANPTV